LTAKPFILFAPAVLGGRFPRCLSSLPAGQFISQWWIGHPKIVVNLWTEFDKNKIMIKIILRAFLLMMFTVAVGLSIAVTLSNPQLS